jgi:hypothetical protein
MIKTPLSEEAGFIFICHYNQNVDFAGEHMGSDQQIDICSMS